MTETADCLDNNPKFKVNDKVLFIDPHSEQEAYGRIVSDYDFRHGISAPTIVRGDGKKYYLVEFLALLSNIGGIQAVLNGTIILPHQHRHSDDSATILHKGNMNKYDLPTDEELMQQEAERLMHKLPEPSATQIMLAHQKSQFESNQRQSQQQSAPGKLAKQSSSYELYMPNLLENVHSTGNILSTHVNLQDVYNTQLESAYRYITLSEDIRPYSPLKFPPITSQQVRSSSSSSRGTNNNSDGNNNDYANDATVALHRLLTSNQRKYCMFSRENNAASNRNNYNRIGSNLITIESDVQRYNKVVSKYHFRHHKNPAFETNKNSNSDSNNTVDNLVGSSSLSQLHHRFINEKHVVIRSNNSMDTRSNSNIVAVDTMKPDEDDSFYYIGEVKYYFNNGGKGINGNEIRANSRMGYSRGDVKSNGGNSIRIGSSHNQIRNASSNGYTKGRSSLMPSGKGSECTSTNNDIPLSPLIVQRTFSSNSNLGDNTYNEAAFNNYDAHQPGDNSNYNIRNWSSHSDARLGSSICSRQQRRKLSASERIDSDAYSPLKANYLDSYSGSSNDNSGSNMVAVTRSNVSRMQTLKSRVSTANAMNLTTNISFDLPPTTANNISQDGSNNLYNQYPSPLHMKQASTTLDEFYNGYSQQLFPDEVEVTRNNTAVSGVYRTTTGFQDNNVEIVGVDTYFGKSSLSNGSETAINNEVVNQSFTTGKNITKRVLLPEQIREIVCSQLTSDAATLRTYINAIVPTAEGIERLSKDSMYKKLEKLYMLSENDLCYPEDRQKLLINQKFTFLHKFLDVRFVGIYRKMLKKGFVIWKRNMGYLRIRKRNYAAQKIQAYVRRWLCRNEIAHQRNLYYLALKQKHATVHAQFRYTSKDTPNAITFNHIQYFATVADCNRYVTFLRKCMYKVVRVLTVKKNTLMKMTLIQWRKATKQFMESNFSSGHFEPHKINHLKQISYPEFISDVAVLHGKYQKSVAISSKIGATAAAKLNPISNNDWGYNTIINMPLGMNRQAVSTATATIALGKNIVDASTQQSKVKL